MRNMLSTLTGVDRTNTHDTSNTSSRASANPSRGERTIAAAVTPRPLQTMAPRPAFMKPAPARPPIRAWELLEGMPSHQVIKFHAIAPDRAPNITPVSTTSADTIPVPTVWATLRPKNRKATKLKKAAHATAYCGGSTRVDTTVAIELAAS
jgi:hypothetical protein